MASNHVQICGSDYAQQLKERFVGTSILQAPAPSAVLDLAKVESNCTKMLDAVDKLGCSWRAHIKTHKTTELARLQVGPGPRPLNLIVSTVLEAENITPLVIESQKAGRKCDLLYGFPLNRSAVQRLARVAEAIGPNSLSIMVDHVEQLQIVNELAEQLTAHDSRKVNLYVKVDMGGARAGVVQGSQACQDLIEGLQIEKNKESFNFVGLYSHAGHSYSGNNKVEALTYLNEELAALLAMTKIFPITNFENFTLTVGATPSTTSIRNLISSHRKTAEETDALETLRETIEQIKAAKFQMEIHAGVYPVLDVQQLATHALPEEDLNWDNLALTILTEVASLYTDRAHPEALIAAGSLVIGHDSCKAYAGWGIVSPWNRSEHTVFSGPPEGHKGWQVAKVSQEHGILRWTGENEKMDPLTIGQKLRIWPNHACIAGAGFGYYLVVDSRKEGREDEIVDVWIRWNGW